MKSLLTGFLADECGQDLTEYSLLMVFVLTAIIAIASGWHTSMAGITNVTSTDLAAGVVSATS